MISDPAQTALVLSGGGAYGAFSVGVMKTLFAGRSPATGYEPLDAGIFTGTSVGAFNAALMVARSHETTLQHTLELENIWLDLVASRPGKCGNGIFRIRGNPADFLNPACLRHPAHLVSHLAGDTVAAGGYLISRTANFLASSAALDERIVNLVNVGSLIDSSSFASLLHEVIDERKIRESPLLLRVTATDFIAGVARYFLNSDFHDSLGIEAVMASTAIPGIFPPVEIDGDIYVDGGVVENTPLNSAITAGATHLHVIYLDPNPRFVRLSGEANTLETILRVYYTVQATKIAEDIETARWINAGLDAVAAFQANGAISDHAIRDFVRVAAKITSQDSRTYKRLVIHRYFPEAQLGNNLGMLNFDRDAIVRMIAEGQRVALLHDCRKNRCVL
ncbi:MAG TPA: patatin-like phospholipase family protein [Bryobacteraceae bacterium]|nr:patatin-like phospholipase family protein [Bryobacteraceae bacterium]